MLLDATNSNEWVTGAYGEDLEYRRTDEGIVIPQGIPLAGLVYRGTPPDGAFELEVRARREYGGDFFLGVTFPVGEEHLTLVLGGWGGAVCGLSCVDGLDASEGTTRTLRSFPNGKYFDVRIEMTGARVDAFIDGEHLLGQALEGRRLSLRPEVLPSAPLGLSSFATCTTVQRVRWRPL